MRLKYLLKDWWYFHAAFALFSVTAIAYAVVLWLLPLTLLLLTFTEVATRSGPFVASTIVILAGLIMCFFQDSIKLASLYFTQLTRLLGAPARYGLHLLDRIDQENMVVDKDK